MRSPTLRSSHWIWVTLLIPGLLSAAEAKSDLSRLRGTWGVIEYNLQGRSLEASQEVVWIFSGTKLYQRGIEEKAFAIEIHSNTEPKGMDLRPRVRNGRRDMPLKLMAYKFEGDRLVVAIPRPGGKRPESFETGVGGSANQLTILRKINDDDTLDDVVLAQFGDDPLPHSVNPDAERVLLTLFSNLTKDGSRAKIEAYVEDGNAKPLLQQFRQYKRPENLAEYLTRVGVRDVEPGEQLIYADGTKQMIEEKHLTSTRFPLVLVSHGEDVGFFWLTRKDGQWKVDATNFIEVMIRGGTTVVGDIRIGMDRERVPELLEDFRKAHNLRMYKVIIDTEAQLDVEWEGFEKIDVGYICRHEFKFAKGRLASHLVHGRMLGTD